MSIDGGGVGCVGEVLRGGPECGGERLRGHLGLDDLVGALLGGCLAQPVVRGHELEDRLGLEEVLLGLLVGVARHQAPALLADPLDDGPDARVVVLDSVPVWKPTCSKETVKPWSPCRTDFW